MTTEFCCAKSRLASVLVLPALLVLLPSAGCVQTAALWANMTGGDVVEAKYKLMIEPLLILIDDPESLVAEPRALRHVHKKISDEFLEMNANRRVVPFEDWRALQRSAKNYDKLSIRQIGEKLGTKQVLYIRVKRFTLHAEPGAPLFKGDFSVRVKVLTTERKPDVRLWPRDEAGHRISVSTDAIPTDGDKSADDVAKDLSDKLGHAVARLFYQHRELEE